MPSHLAPVFPKIVCKNSTQNPRPLRRLKNRFFFFTPVHPSFFSISRIDSVFLRITRIFQEVLEVDESEFDADVEAALRVPGFTFPPVIAFIHFFPHVFFAIFFLLNAGGALTPQRSSPWWWGFKNTHRSVRAFGWLGSVCNKPIPRPEAPLGGQGWFGGDAKSQFRIWAPLGGHGLSGSGKWLGACRL